jgi:hypothetical protein
MITLPIEYWYVGTFIVLCLLTWFGYRYFYPTQNFNP